MLDFKLYAITDRWLTKDLKQFASEAAGHGLRALRMRETDMEPKDSFRLAMGLRNAIPQSKLFLSPPDGAEEIAGAVGGFAGIVGANGIHLPERAIGNEWSPKRIKGAFASMLCGVSVHSSESAQKAEAWGADFLTFGPVYATPSKQAMGFGPQGVDKLADMVKKVKIPVFAIGGITPAGARICVDNGAWGVAVVRDLLVAPNLGERLDEYREILGKL
jgi:thiamine-phosphate pyrophosphorylase